jgi:hypothetical protein
MKTEINTIDELLAVHNIKKIESFDSLKKYFDVELLDEDGTPKILCEQKVVIFCDNLDFNETYLIDIINAYLDEVKYIKESVDFLYIDNFDVRKELLAKNIFWDKASVDQKAFEKTYLSPCILTINPIKDELSYFQEMIAPFDLTIVKKIMQNTKIEE